jgi:long-chain-fatty-acid--CoA ligase ACSBG
MCKIEARVVDKAEDVISYLPLSHVAAQVLDIHIPMLCTATVYFAQPDALKVSFFVSYVRRNPRSV